MKMYKIKKITDNLKYKSKNDICITKVLLGQKIAFIVSIYAVIEDLFVPKLAVEFDINNLNNSISFKLSCSRI